MAKKTETKNENVERVYVVPLLKEWNKVPRYKRAKKAIRAIREFVVRHMKIRGNDAEKKVRIDRFVNEEVWFRGIKKPPMKIKIKAIQEASGNVRVELADFENKPNLKFKKLREERASQSAEEKKKSKSAKKAVPVEKEEEMTEEEVKEEKEKEGAVKEAGEKLTEMKHKQEKHQTKIDKGPKHQRRKALQK